MTVESDIYNMVPRVGSALDRRPLTEPERQKVTALAMKCFYANLPCSKEHRAFRVAQEIVRLKADALAWSDCGPT